MQKHMPQLIKVMLIVVVVLWVIPGLVFLMFWLKNVGGVKVLTPLSLLMATVFGLSAYRSSNRIDTELTQDRINQIATGLMIGVVSAWSIATGIMIQLSADLTGGPIWLLLISGLAFFSFGVSGCYRLRSLGCINLHDRENPIEIRPNVESVLLFGFLLPGLVVMGLMGMQRL